MIIVHDLHKSRVYLCASADKARNGDEAGVQIALDHRETIEIGRTIYEYNVALNRFIAEKGKRWKSALKRAWETGDYSGARKEDIPALQRLRNNVMPISGLH